MSARRSRSADRTQAAQAEAAATSADAATIVAADTAVLAPPGLATPSIAISLRVSGGKPLRAKGSLLVAGSNRIGSATLWHDIALYRCEGGDIAVAIAACKAPPEPDIHHAEIFPRMVEAADWLEAFDPTADLTVQLDAADRSRSTADIALQAASLRQRTDDLRRQYGTLIGDLLYRLDFA